MRAAVSWVTNDEQSICDIAKREGNSARPQSIQECGMDFKKYEDMRVGDVIGCFHVETEQRTL